MTKKVSSDPERMYSPVSFQQIVLTCSETENLVYVRLDYHAKNVWHSELITENVASRFKSIEPGSWQHPQNQLGWNIYRQGQLENSSKWPNSLLITAILINNRAMTHLLVLIDYNLILIPLQHKSTSLFGLISLSLTWLYLSFIAPDSCISWHSLGVF